MDDEVLDLVNDQDEVISTIKMSDKSGNMGGNLRAAEMFIINDKGQLWIPRRQTHKKIAPGGLDFSASGHVSSGEDYKTALLREVKEELGLDIDESKLEFMHKFSPVPGQPAFFRAVYLYHSNESPNYNKDDFSEFYWFTPEELIQKLKDGEPAKISLIGTTEYLAANT